MAGSTIDVQLTVDSSAFNAGLGDAASTAGTSAQAIAASFSGMADTAVAAITQLGLSLSQAPAKGAADAASAFAKLSADMKSSLGGMSASGQGSQVEELRSQLAQLTAAFAAAQHAFAQTQQAAARQVRLAAGQDLQDEIDAEIEANAQRQQIAADTAKADAKISALELKTRKEELDAEVTAHQITAAQRLAIERQLTKDTEAQAIERLNAELSALSQEPVKEAQIANEIRVLRAKLDADLAGLDRQAAMAAKRDAGEQAQAWREAIGEITNAEDTFIRDVLTKRQSMTKSLERMSAQLVLREIEDDAKYYTTKLLYNLLGLESDKLTEQGGVLVHLLAEKQKTASTAAGNTTRTALDNTSETTWLGRVATQLAQWLGLETGKSAATATGDGTRTTADAAAAIASRAAAVATGFSQISIEAAIAAAAAFADSASLGPPGLIAAPGVAAAAYGTVMGFASGMGAAAIPSAAGGMVVGDDGLIMAHAQEMVLPAHLSTGIQDMIDGGAGAGASGGGGSTTSLSPSFNISAIDAKSVVALFNNPNIMRQFARNLSGYMAMNPSVRGAY